MNVHAHDCAPCDAARQVIDALATTWDPNDQWSEVDSVTKTHPTLRDEAIAIAADTLHRLPIPNEGSRPSRIEGSRPAAPEATNTRIEGSPQQPNERSR